MALTESATHGLSFGEQCELVVQQIEAARFLISKRWIALSPFSSAHEKAPQCGAGCETGSRGCRPCGRRVSGQGKTKVPKAGGLRLDDKGVPPVGCYRRGAVVKAAAAPAIALDRYRGWGRYPLARIRAQRAPVFSPAGTGTEYRRPQAVSWHLAALRAKASGDCSRMDGSTSISGIAASAIRGSNDLLALQAVIGLCRTRTPLQKGTRAGESRGTREICPAVGSGRRGRGRLGRQFALGRRRGGPDARLDAPRLPAAASSTGCVPLQSG